MAVVIHAASSHFYTSLLVESVHNHNTFDTSLETFHFVRTCSTSHCKCQIVVTSRKETVWFPLNNSTNSRSGFLEASHSRNPVWKTLQQTTATIGHQFWCCMSMPGHYSHWPFHHCVTHRWTFHLAHLQIILDATTIHPPSKDVSFASLQKNSKQGCSRWRMHASGSGEVCEDGSALVACSAMFCTGVC